MSRQKILERRARFVTAALFVATGCNRGAENNPASPVPSSEAKVTAPKPAAPKPPPSVPPPADRPPLTAKVTVSGDAKRAAAATKIEAIHDAVKQTADAIPAGCVLTDPACHTRFKLFHERLADLREQVYALGPPRCPPKLADDIAIEAMVSAHRSWLYAWLDAIDKAGKEAALAQADAGSEWDELRSEAANAHPHPCLKFACP